ACRTLKRIEGTVDLDRADLAACVFKLPALRKIPRIKDSAPGGVRPARDSDPEPAHASLSSGSRATKRVCVLLSSRKRRPPWLRATSRERLRPRPVPCPGALVVKKGSKMR